MPDELQEPHARRSKNYRTNALGERVWEYKKRIRGLDPGEVIEHIDDSIRFYKMPYTNSNSEANKRIASKIFGYFKSMLTKKPTNYIWNWEGSLKYEIKCVRGKLRAKVWSINEEEIDGLRKLLEAI